jgi:hypothetical protein
LATEFATLDVVAGALQRYKGVPKAHDLVAAHIPGSCIYLVSICVQRTYNHVLAVSSWLLLRSLLKQREIQIGQDDHIIFQGGPITEMDVR